MSGAPEIRQTGPGGASTLYLIDDTLARNVGIDRLTTGLALAARHVSQDPSQQHAARRGVHPDVLLLEPATSRGKIGIDQVREILRAAQFVPEQGERRVCLIPQAERLTPQAANALLKVLEEPPRGMMFLLVAAHAQDVLPTVLSRLRVVRTTSVSDGVTAGPILQQDGDAGPGAEGETEADAAIDLRSAAGLDRALSHSSYEIRARGAAHAMEAIERKDRRSVLALAQSLAKRDDAEIKSALGALMQHCAALLREDVRRTGGTAPKAERCRQRKLAALCRAIDEAQRALWVYTPKETVLVRLFLDATEEETDT
ncbi:hypothetical protein JW848_05635 [Candidatus Bipolaricaulota bacterium]|nr:hypothetical protein [Candidatus Bipolaricaulota bacterium]